MKFLLFLFLLTFSTVVWSQVSKVTVSGVVHGTQSNTKLPYVNVVVKSIPDSVFIAGTVTNDDGLFSVAGISPGNYLMELSYLGYSSKRIPLLIGRLSEYIDLGTIDLEEGTTTLDEVVIEGAQDAISIERKIFKMEDNINQSGGSLLQVMQNLPGVTISEEGTVRLRGSDRITVLIDGKQHSWSKTQGVYQSHHFATNITDSLRNYYAA